MATVVRPQFGAEINAGPTPGLSVQATPEAFGGGVAQGLEAVGGAIQQRASVQAELNNNSAANDAVSQLMRVHNDTLYAPGSGLFSKQGKDAMDQYPHVLEGLDKAREDIEATLPSPMARQLYDQQSRRLQSYAESRASSYIAEQQKNYWAQSSKSLIQASADTAALNWNDDRAFGAAISMATQQQHNIDAMHGLDYETSKQNVQNVTSGIWTRRVEQMSDSDPLAAKDLYDKNRVNFNATDQLRLDNMFKVTLKPILADRAANYILGGGATASTDDVAKINFKLESGGQGNAAPENNGHFGAGQLAPDTAMGVARDLGIPFDLEKMKEKSAEGTAYNQTLGKGYISQMMERYSGNPALASMAYIAGPGNVDKWISRFGDPRSGEVSLDKFIDQVDKAGNPQSAARARNVLEALGSLKSTSPTSQDPREHLQDWMTQARDTYGETPMGLAVESALKKKVGEIAQEQHASQSASYQDLLTTVSGGADGQGPKITSDAQLFADPQLKEAYLHLNQTQRDALEHHMISIATGADAKTAEGQVEYTRLKGMQKLDPAAFAQADVAGLKGVTPAQQTELLVAQKQAQTSGAGTDKAFSHALSVAKLFFPEVSKMSAQGGDKQHYAEFAGRLDNEIQNFQQVHKRLPNDSDIRKITAQLTTPIGGFGLFGIGSKPSYLIKANDVPKEDQAAIQAAYTKKFKVAPTPDQIVRFYTLKRQSEANAKPE